MLPAAWADLHWRRYVCAPDRMTVEPIGRFAQLDAQGVYFLWRDGGLRYVGMATSIAHRLRQHLAARRIAFDEASMIPVDGLHVGEFMLRSVECAYIRALQPPDNLDNGSWGRWRGAERMSKVIRRLWRPYRRSEGDQSPSPRVALGHILARWTRNVLRFAIY